MAFFLVALGAALDALRLSARQSAALFWTALIGTYVNSAATTIAAAFGTAALSPITSAGHHGQPWQESLVTLGFVAMAVTITACAVLAMVGARRIASS